MSEKKIIVIEGKTYFYSNVVMLPSNEKAKIGSILPYSKVGDVKEVDHLLIADAQLLEQWNLGKIHGIVYHLYFLSDEEIKEGDWVEFERKIFKATPELVRNKTKGDGWNKIIATKDNSLRVRIEHPLSIEHKSLPQPSELFLDLFVTEYNRGYQINQALVEYEDDGEEGWTGSDADGEPTWIEKWVLKINKDNTINVFKTEVPIAIDREIINNIIKYCEDKQVYDKLGGYGDFYYKLKKLI